METITKIPKVGRVKIENYGIIKNAEIEFSDKLNIITGINGSGKTTVINFLREKFDPQRFNLSKREETLIKINNALDETGILMDGVLERLREEDLSKVLDKFSKSGKQIIFTLNKAMLPKISGMINANLIDTKNFELEKENLSLSWRNLEDLRNSIASKDLLEILKCGNEFEVKTGTEEELINYNFNEVKGAVIIVEVAYDKDSKRGLDTIKKLAEKMEDETKVIWSVERTEEITSEKINLFLVK